MTYVEKSFSVGLTHRRSHLYSSENWNDNSDAASPICGTDLLYYKDSLVDPSSEQRLCQNCKRIVKNLLSGR